MPHAVPEIKAMEMQNIKLPQKVQFSNGVPLFLINGGVHEVVRLDLLFRGGYAVQSRPLQALFTNRMLREGNSVLNAAAVSRKLDSCGAWMETYSSQNCNHITLYTLRRHLPELLKVLAEIVKNPAFPQKNLDVVRRANKSHFLINSRKVDVVAQRHFEKAIWGSEHKFGRLVCAEDYDAVTVELLREYYGNVYGSQNCTIFLSGKFDDCEVEKLGDYFGKEQWGASSRVSIDDLPPLASMRGRVNVKVDDTMQSGIKIGMMAVDSSHPDFYTLKYLSVLLGGFFGSRLMTNVRERNGYTYHIEADLSAFGHRNAFSVTSEAANEYVQPLIDEVYNEFHRLQTEPVFVEEMEKLRNCTLGELCREYEGVLAKADVFINTWLSGEAFDGVNSYLDVVRNASPDDFMRLACKYLIPENMVEVVAGV
ncbi:MAG: insulinase family protein [Bacteroidaceae bacterium]|nr:insulinase family protein [Bacteroidaceae bacterium]